MKIGIGLLALALAVGGCARPGSSPAASSSAGSSATSPASMVPMSPLASPSVAASAAPVVTTPPDATPLKVLDFKILPASATVHGTFALYVTNDGPTVHNVTIRDQAGKVQMGTRDLRQGESAVLSGTLQPGTYVMFCSLPGHESLGTRGTLVVTP